MILITTWKIPLIIGVKEQNKIVAIVNSKALCAVRECFVLYVIRYNKRAHKVTATEGREQIKAQKILCR